MIEAIVHTSRDGRDIRRHHRYELISAGVANLVVSDLENVAVDRHSIAGHQPLPLRKGAHGHHETDGAAHNSNREGCVVDIRRCVPKQRLRWPEDLDEHPVVERYRLTGNRVNYLRDFVVHCLSLFGGLRAVEFKLALQDALDVIATRNLAWPGVFA